MKIRAFYLFAWVGILAGLLLSFTVLYWLFFPYNPLMFTQPTEILTKEVYGGDTLAYKVHFCKYMNLPATLTKQYVDTVIYATDPKTTNNKVGCQTITSYNNVPNLPSGMYQMRLMYQYKVNPLRTITVTEYTEKFEIRETTQSGGI